MRHLAFAFVVPALLTFGACSTVPGGNSFDLATVQTNAQTAGKLVTAASCAVGDLSQTAGGVARRKVRGGGTLGGRNVGQTIHQIAVVSKAACSALDGLFQGAVTVPASQVTPVAPAAT